MRNFKIKICFVLFLMAFTSIAAAQIYVRKIQYARLNVFDKELEHRNNFLYRMANKLHVATREGVVRRDMLLVPGGKFDEKLLQESLRNLRSRVFIGDAVAEIDTVSGDSVDLKIVSEDLWTTVLGLSSQGGGGSYQFSAFGDEKNVAGLGIGLETTFQRTSDKNNGFSINAYDSHFLGSRYTANLWLSRFAFEHLFGLNLSRPFYSLQTRWSLGSSVEIDQTKQRLFSDGDEYFRYQKEYDYFAVKGVRAFGINTRAEPYVEYLYTQYRYGVELPTNPYNYLIPKDEIFSGPGVGANFQIVEYATAHYLDQFGPTEDLAYRYSLDMHVDWSGNTFGGDMQGAYFGIYGRIFRNPIKGCYLGLSDSYSHYLLNSQRQRIINRAEAVIYYKPAMYHLFAFHYLSTFAWRQKDDYQLTLGGDTGLRGYPNRYFGGTKLAMVNGEYRLFTPYKIFTVGLGAAAFFDAGYVWHRGQAIHTNDLQRDIGLGFRFGLTKSSTARTARIDFAWALDRKTSFISFGTGNVFDLGSFQ